MALRIRKRFLLLGGAIVAVAAVLLFGNPVNRAVTAAVEAAGSHVTGTPVDARGVRIAWSDAGGRAAELRIGNPDGFSDDPALVLGGATFTLDAGTLTPENLRGEAPIVIKELSFGSADVRFEFGRDGRSNLDALKDHIQRPRPGIQGVNVRLVIEKLTVGGGRIVADTGPVGGPEVARDLPGFSLHGLGLPDGSSPAQLGEEFLAAFLRETTEAAAKGELRSVLQDKLKGLLGR